MIIGQKLILKNGEICTVNKVNEYNDLFQIAEDENIIKNWYGDSYIDYKETIIKYMNDITCDDCSVYNYCTGECIFKLIAKELDEQFN